MKKKLQVASCMFLVVMLFSAMAFTEDHSSCPLHKEHMAEVAHKGDQVMGFEHTKSSHHFLLKADGGVILADALDSHDRKTIEQIRMHFVETAKMFSQGDFSNPQKVHSTTPPGVPDLVELKDSISYKFQEREKGGEVVISTKDERALKAIHAFLRFQIEEHNTGDPL